MTELQLFNFEGNNLSTIFINDEIFFYGYELAGILGYSNSRDALSRHVDEEDKIILTSENTTLENFPNRGITGVNESGMYSLILGSKLESSKKFKRWVTKEVLPAIRKTGSYQKPMTMEDMMISQLEDMKLVKQDVTMLKESMRISGTQEFSIKQAGNIKAIDCLGGSDSRAYDVMSRKVFAQLWRDFKKFFKLPRYSELAKVDYERGLSFINVWQPDTATRIEIDEINNQERLDIA